LEFKKIVVAYDGSADSGKAIGFAARLAEKFGGEITVVHVYSSPMIYSGAAGLPAPDVPGLEEAAREGGKKVLAEGLALAKKEGADAKGELLEAPSIVQAVADYSAGHEADLIVVGTRGMTGFKKLVLGSVSSGLVSHAHCPVLVVR
jgi:nucleotide-binding universal stress UspA family protein